MRIIDISHDLFKVPVYPGDPEPYVDEIRSIQNGFECNLNAVYTCLHAGTHIDAPNHFVDGAPTIEKIPLGAFIGECMVIEAPPEPITGDYVEKYFPRQKERLLIKAGGQGAFIESGALACVEAGIKLIGVDSPSVGIKGQQGRTHRAFQNADTVILEYLNLADVAPGNYFLIALPLRLSGLEASPCRAVLIADYLFWSGTPQI